MKPFLRSGSMHDVLALGENGQPVYACALQLRETLRIRQHPLAADCLAIPQPNEAGTRIDWYAPFPGKVTSWLAASDAQRMQALHQLERHLSTFLTLVAQTQNTEHPSQRLFGALLAKAMQIPDQHHVYLVDDKPVLTFWGFIKPQAQFQDDPLACLRLAEEPAEEPMPVATAARKVAISIPKPVSKPAAVTPPTMPPIPAPETPATAPPARQQRHRYVWIVAALMLLTLLVGWLSQLNSPLPPIPAVQQPAPLAPFTVPALSLQLPLAPATLMPPEPVALPPKPVNLPPEPVTLPPADKNLLVLPTESVKAGSTRFLNGKWQATVALQVPFSDKYPSLQYHLNGGKGTVSLRHGNGNAISCRASIEAGLMPSGNLVIKSRTKARCNDGSRYTLPEITCKQNETGPAECFGRYNAETTYPMMLKRENK
ncbi:SrfA family protein [Serratia symbiotica]|nr:SrfA family protein [Serratia symbiotica]